MSHVTAVPLRPVARSTVTRLVLGFVLLIGAAFLLAFAGAGRIPRVKVETVQAGSGPLITDQDAVLIDYEGRLDNGTVFDTTKGRGPAGLLAAEVVPGFTKALEKMQKGGSYKVHIPWQLAYGDTQRPGSPIPAKSNLNFDIHVIDVKPNVLQAYRQQMQQMQAMQQMMQQQQGSGQGAPASAPPQPGASTPQ